MCFRERPSVEEACSLIRRLRRSHRSERLYCRSRKHKSVRPVLPMCP
ncbi:hypothetical protein PPTG_20237 [Phytophthora nicotianae INRA-310]|uniref:Uncharacterized protein n=1 Tax=Phytophthora nicotianae (strain INRA-310) TaxID=761204 RepID=W2PB81_PHYN3|nr:hypothetical protein PPTG_20237 [Phytophthora nicotianae INRA-310]ETM97493.1 hypothetical protein PPTG_20237 [Phytophthora nicotianae INRA-310]